MGQILVYRVGNTDVACGPCGMEFANDAEIDTSALAPVLDSLESGGGDGAIGICVHHEPMFLAAISATGRAYAPVAVGEIKGIITKAGVAAVIPALDPHVAAHPVAAPEE